jgi:hypothetical protein
MKRFFAFVLLAACSGASPGAGTTEQPTATIAQSDVEHDLVLEVTRKNNEGYDDNRDPRFQVWLVNRSKTTSYPIVLSNDGSESGWREPTIGWTAEMKTSGTWQAVPKVRVLRCGLYAQDWTTDVKTIAPGERIELPWFALWGMGEVGDATHVRFVAHYAYGEHARDKSKVPPILHAMPEYAIASTPFEIEVKRPLRLEIDRGEIFMVNQTNAPFSFDAFEKGSLEIEIEGKDSVSIESVVQPKTIAAGARVKIADAGKLEPGKKRAIWVGYDHVGDTTNTRRVVSAWAQGQQ